jgi:hypothetical protein
MAEENFYIQIHEYDRDGMRVDNTPVPYPSEKDVWYDFVFDYRPEWTNSLTRIWVKSEHEDSYTKIVDTDVPVTGAYREEMAEGWHMDFAFYMYRLSYTHLQRGESVWPSPHRILSMQYAELRVIELEHNGSDFDAGWAAVAPDINRWSPTGAVCESEPCDPGLILNDAGVDEPKEDEAGSPNEENAPAPDEPAAESVLAGAPPPSPVADATMSGGACSAARSSKRDPTGVALTLLALLYLTRVRRRSVL